MSPEESNQGEKPLRLFTAVDLGQEVLSRVAEAMAPLHGLARHAKWVSPESMHLTLFFFGWVAPDRVPALEEALGRAASGHGPMRLQVRGSGTFGTQAHPRVLWIGLEGEVDALGALQASVTEQVVPLGFEAEHRDFRPHLTLARAREMRGDKALAACREKLEAFDGGEAVIDALTLYRSELSPKGARYTALRRYPLRHAT